MPIVACWIIDDAHSQSKMIMRQWPELNGNKSLISLFTAHSTPKILAKLAKYHSLQLLKCVCVFIAWRMRSVMRRWQKIRPINSIQAEWATYIWCQLYHFLLTLAHQSAHKRCCYKTGNIVSFIAYYAIMSYVSSIHYCLCPWWYSRNGMKPIWWLRLREAANNRYPLNFSHVISN